MRHARILLVIFALVLLSATVVTAQDAQPSGDLEIFSWWTGGGEAAGLDALIAKFTEMYPDVNVINSAVAGGSGVNARAVLTTRMLGGDPPDTFQVHAGQELYAQYVVPGLMEPLNDIYEANGWMDQFPEGLVNLMSDAEGNVYSVAVNIHRSNVMYYVPANLEQWGVTPPASWQEFIDTTCPALQEADVVPLAVGTNWTQAHLWESIALAGLGAEGYNGLWNGATNWSSPEVVGVFDTFGKVLDCTNDDRDAIDWQPAAQMVVEGNAAFNVMGDWAVGYFITDLGLEAGTDFAWMPSPGTEGTFIMLSDSFGLPKNVKHPDNVRAWLTFLGSAEAQDIFNPLKGSLPANTTADINNSELYNAYFQDAYQDWTTNVIVGSQAHGAVAPPAFSNEFANVIATFAADHNAQAAGDASQALAEQTGMAMASS
ncbi:MAG: carbohydrate ABC transporter substrate-binding protein [Anaerolineae bacterium]|nr:carbohydrate ABC transporter substrate-binding protein [Anaerolineae bacterium]